MARIIEMAIAGLLVVGLASAAAAAPLTLTISPAGRDTWSGRRAAPNAAHTDGPLATVAGARDAIRKLKAAGGLPVGGVMVDIRKGVYEMSGPLSLTAEDSGTAAAPVVYRAHPGATVRILGGRMLKEWRPVTDRAVLDRLDPAARAHVVQTNLRAQGITDYGVMKSAPNWGDSEAGLQLFYNERPMTLARWPNKGFAPIMDVAGPTPVNVRGTKGCKEGMIVYQGSRPDRWVGEKNIMLEGYWFWDWADQREKVASIDTTKHIITLEPPDSSFGYRKGQWFYAYNILSELDEPGEWYLDRDRGILYFWPPSPIARGQAMVSVIPSLFNLNGASFVTLRGLTMEGFRDAAVTVTGGQGNHLIACAICNGGGWGVHVTSSTRSSVEGCDIYQIGDGGITLDGGDRKTLTPGNLAADNNYIHDYSQWNPVYKPGITLSGDGNRATHNLIDRAPHMGIGFSGNDQVIEYNEMHSLCWQSNDAGVIYAGRDWTMRGNQIRYNYIHHVYGFQGRGCVGIYLDDQFSSADLYGNVLYHVPTAILIGGGRDNTIENSVFVDCGRVLAIDARGLGWAAPGEAGLMRKLNDMPYKTPPWSTRYPQLVNILNEDPMAPSDIKVLHNICWHGQWDAMEGKARPAVTLQDNLVNEDPRFVDAAHGDFRLRPDSPALKMGFKPIPFDKIGLYKSPDRASWPVHSTVMPPPATVPPERVGLRYQKPVVVPSIAAPADPMSPAKNWAALTLKETPDRTPAAGAPCQVRLAHFGDTLYVTLTAPVKDAGALKTGTVWGANDGAEVCFQDRSGKKAGPIFVLHGFAAGVLRSATDAGAPEAAARRLGAAVHFTARVEGNQWIGSWVIPLQAAGIQARPGARLGFNVGVFRSESDEWLEWAGTTSQTWRLDGAGMITLQATRSRPIIGAIRWDAWHTPWSRVEAGASDGPVHEMEISLGPRQYHYRLPFFAKVVSDNEVRIDGYTQKIVDREIAYAKAGGLDYWAFLLYAPDSPMSQGLSLYLSSHHRRDVNFCAIASPPIFGNASAFPTGMERVLDLMAEPGYQKAPGGRPLLYIFDVSDASMHAWGGPVKARRLFDGLRSAAKARGEGDPYIVVMDFDPSHGKMVMDAIGANAISSYVASHGNGHALPYAELARSAHAFWDQCAATGAQVVPIAMAGWDRRPRVEHPVSWEKYQKPGVGLGDYFVMPTPVELAAHVEDAMRWAAVHRKQCPAQTVVIYAWNEHDEGGFLCPTLNTDGSANFTRLTAIREMLRRFHARAPVTGPRSPGNGALYRRTGK